MKHVGTVLRIQHDRSGPLLILDTNFGPRAVSVEKAWLQELVEEAGLDKIDAIVGWGVEWDPARGDLELYPLDDEDDDDETSGDEPAGDETGEDDD